MNQRGFQSLTVAIAMFGTAVLIALILLRTDGALIYTLDDPYIHLALAQEILRGGYGINPGEAASPSSSILYAPLLAPLLALGFGDWSPLILSWTGMGVALWLLAGATAPLVAGSRIFAILIALVLPLSINGFALPLTGMEHPIHAAATVAVILGIWHSAQGRVPGWLIPAILLTAAIRFEGYGLAIAAILTLLALRQTRAALITLLLLTALTLAYAATMHALGLPPLPSSVMVKSQVSAAAADADALGLMRRLLENPVQALSNRWGLIFAVASINLAALTLAPRVTRQTRAVAFMGFSVLAAHLLVGRYGWFGRYEVYAVAALLCTCLLLLQSFGRGATVLAFVILTYSDPGYLLVTTQTPAAALSIHEQQHQMHRFATRYFPHPVAVNDLGWVAYDNDQRVLDLWGLGSEAARRLTRQSGRTTDTLRQLTAGETTYAMIYDIAFAGAIPSEWCRIATLTTSRVIAASDEVAFYLLDTTLEAPMRAALAEFAASLPPGATLTTLNCEG